MTTAVAHEASRALDALIAERVMGFTRFRLFGEDHAILAPEEGMREVFKNQYQWDEALKLASGIEAPMIAFAHELPLRADDSGLNWVPRYSFDLMPAWLLMERVAREIGTVNHQLDDRNGNGNGFSSTVSIVGWGTMDGRRDLMQLAHETAGTFPLALCRAALAALDLA